MTYCLGIMLEDGDPFTYDETDVNPSFIHGRQISSPPRLSRIYATGNFIETGDQTPYFQTRETKYVKPIIDWLITRSTTLNAAAKCVLVFFKSTVRGRFDPGDIHFATLGMEWSAGTREIFGRLPDPDW